MAQESNDRFLPGLTSPIDLPPSFVHEILVLCLEIIQQSSCFSSDGFPIVIDRFGSIGPNAIAYPLPDGFKPIMDSHVLAPEGMNG
jgi:hypothetical protein